MRPRWSTSLAMVIGFSLSSPMAAALSQDSDGVGTFEAPAVAASLTVSPSSPDASAADMVEVSVRVADRVATETGEPLRLESRRDGGSWSEIGLLDPMASVEIAIPTETVVEFRAGDQLTPPEDPDAWLLSEPIWATVDAAGQVAVVAPPRRTLVVAGDIAGCSWSGDARTADLVASLDGIVMTAGDNAYQVATLPVLRACYGPTWGRFKSRTRPVLGNHDDFGAFFAYFGRKAGPRGRGYYAFDLGAWRVYALDTNCELRQGCTKGSAQYRWLKRDLERHRPRCSLAVMHHPMFSSGPHRNSIRTVELVKLLYRAGNELVVNGHDHIYERFDRSRPLGGDDPEHGMRQFIVGTGGAPLYAFRSDGRRPPHSRVRQNRIHGVLRLRLGSEGYEWDFLPARRTRFSDSGETACHEPPPRR